MRRIIPVIVLMFSIAATAISEDVPLVCCASGGSVPRVALTRTGAAFVWSLDGLRATVTDQLPPIPPENQIILSSAGYRSPAIASDGRDALVVWVEGSLLYASLIGPGLDRSRTVLAFGVGGAAPAVAWNGSKYVVAWSHVSNAVLTTTVEPSGSYGGIINVLARNAEQVPDSIAIASSGGDSLVVWNRTTYDLTCFCSQVLTVQVDSMIVDRDGRPRSNPSIVSMNGSNPDVAWNGREYFVTWTGFPDRGIFGRRMSIIGTAIDAEPIAIAPVADFGGQIAWNGSSYFLIWFHQVFAQYQVFYATMSDRGVLGTLVPFAGRFTSDFDIAARANGLVVLARTPDPRLAGTITLRYIEPRRRSVTP